MNEIIKDLENKYKYKDDINVTSKIVLTTISSINSQIEDKIPVDVKTEFNLLFEKIYDDGLLIQKLVFANPELKTILLDNVRKMYVSYIISVSNLNDIDTSIIPDILPKE
jgi:hypothetical protein